MRGSSIAFGIAVSLATIVGACDEGNPTPENTVRPTGIPIHSLTGLVTEPVAVAVEGAAVTVLDGPQKGKSTITDRAGGYALIGVEGGFTIQVTKDGYVSEARAVTVPTNRTLDVEIRPLVLGNIGGEWTVTFEPQSTCQSPLGGNARTYHASIAQQGADLGISLSGANFVTPPQLTGTIHDLDISINLPGGCQGFYCYYYYYGPSILPAVIENLGGNQFLAISGQITARAGRSSIIGTLSGDFVLTRSATLPFDVLASCNSQQHRVTFRK
jgi:hypothetical protein